ncbi:MAG: exodeoxyribonuclease VII small subunit [Dysgonomonas sp.]
MAKTEKSYSETIKELENILDKIDSGEIDVDVLTAEIKKASELIKSCKEKLYKTDKEIKKILNDID